MSQSIASYTAAKTRVGIGIGGKRSIAWRCGNYQLNASSRPNMPLEAPTTDASGARSAGERGATGAGAAPEEPRYVRFRTEKKR